VPGWLADPVMAMLADDPGRRPTADDCAKSLSVSQRSTPFPVLSAGIWRLTGQSGPDEPVTGLADVAPSQDPVTTPVARPATAPGAVQVPGPAPAAADRSGRVNRVIAAIGVAALLLIAGSVTAWRLSTHPAVPGLVAGGPTSPAASYAAATIPVSSAPASRPATAPAGPAATAAPSGSPSGSATGSPSASPTGSPSASPAGSPATTPATTPTDSPSDSPSDDAPDSSAPSLVPVPNVIGMNFPQALRVLESAGFTVAGSHTPPGNVVASESPSGEAPAGSVITVVYGNGK
jgi:hypothetical protein